MKKVWRIATAVAMSIALAEPAFAQADSALRRQQRTVDSLAALVASLSARIAALEARRAAGDSTTGTELDALRAAAAAAASEAGPPQATAAGPTRPGLNALNPEITVTGDLRSNAIRGETFSEPVSVREFEISLQSALDPYSTAKVFVGFEDGEVGLEEAYVYFTALPGHVRLDVGQFRQQVGELNRWHLHALPEDEYPLVIRRFGGEEGLIAPGASLYWPLPFSGRGGAYELTVQATAGNNEVLYGGGSRPAVNAQLLGFWQLNRASFVQASVSGAYGENPDVSLTSTLGVAAARWTWRPPAQAQAREVTLRGELWALRRDFAPDSGEAFARTRLGGYAGASWKLGRRWSASVRGDYVQSPEPGPFMTEWAVTPALTFWQSEFVYARAGYEHARDVADETQGRFTIQMVFSMGPHKHEIF